MIFGTISAENFLHFLEKKKLETKINLGRAKKNPKILKILIFSSDRQIF